MKNKNIVVKKIVHEKVDAALFDCGISLREIARQTGIDVAYLSRVRSGKSPITEENLNKIIVVIEKQVA